MSLKVALVSTFPPLQEGIAQYSFSLAAALSEYHEIQLLVLSSEQTKQWKPNILVIKTWKRNSLVYPFTIFLKALKLRVNIVHIQHEYALYGTPIYGALFPILLFLLKFSRRKSVVTMHSVIITSMLSTEFFEKYGAGQKFASLKRALVTYITKLIIKLADKVIVHQEAAKKELSVQYGASPQKIVVIPHGAASCNVTINSFNAKKRLKVNGPLLFYFGFIRRGRGIEYAIKALKIITEKHPDVRLIIAGDMHPFSTFEGSEYLKELKSLVNQLGLNKNVIFVNRFIPEEELPIYLSATDIFVLPYVEEGVIGASGVLSKIMRYGKSVVATRVYRISDLWNIVPTVKSENAASLANALMKLLETPSLRENTGRKLKELSIKRSWHNVAKKTLSLYQEIIRQV